MLLITQLNKLLDSSSHETDTEIKFELENEVNHLLAEDDDNQVSDTFFTKSKFIAKYTL